jgi:hypothetical protein
MAWQTSVPRKQRTREHVIADQSVNFVERFILDEGHSVDRKEKDYGYDLELNTYDPEGYVEPGTVNIQIKASTKLTSIGGHYVFDLDVRDYNLWTLESTPVFLILCDAEHRRGYWLHVQAYFRDPTSRRPRKGAKTVRVRIPKRQKFDRRAVKVMRKSKQEYYDRLRAFHYV